MFQVYSFSFNNPKRKAEMEERFGKVGLSIHWVDPVLSTDPRIPVSEPNPRTHTIMLNHLDMIRAFLNSDAEYGIFCEDDIHIRRTFQQDIQVAIDAYNRLKLSVLLLGYLTNYRVADTHIHGYHSLLETPFVFTSVGSDLWGSQMYMMNKTQAQKCLDLFVDPTLVKTAYSPDWTITKMPAAACIYPMLAVESGIVATDHWGQIQFHKSCFETNFNDRDYF
jgi:hypothetical protein